MRFSVPFFVLGLVLVAETAEAKCIARSMCVCGDATVAVSGHIVSATGTNIQLQVDAVEGDTSQASVGETIGLTLATPREGDRWIVARSSTGEWQPKVKVMSDGHIDCVYSPSISLTAEEALQLAVATNCSALFEAKADEQGLAKQQCNDTGGETFPLLGACHCSSGSAASLLALVSMLLRWRRRVMR